MAAIAAFRHASVMQRVIVKAALWFMALWTVGSTAHYFFGTGESLGLLAAAVTATLMILRTLASPGNPWETPKPATGTSAAGSHHTSS